MRFLSTSQLLVLLELSVLQVVPSAREEQKHSSFITQSLHGASGRGSGGANTTTSLCVESKQGETRQRDTSRVGEPQKVSLAGRVHTHTHARSCVCVWRASRCERCHTCESVHGGFRGRWKRRWTCRASRFHSRLLCRKSTVSQEFGHTFHTTQRLF